ncbi:BnaA04g09850D [Brassica napus]|uniref:BnaA04g09850D protein n=1 Tax=Brassica napus TaxID=3708 RepID=A0A078I190_BRANA|nr:BnaA04g09850D [Brassica napus]
MLSPQTPRNIRRLQLGLDTFRNQTSHSPKQSSCLTYLTSRDFGSKQLSSTSKQQNCFRSPSSSIQKKRKENSFRKLPDKRQRKRTSAVLKDITNIDFSLATENQESPTSTVFPDTEFGENIDETCELEFDCSSLDATDSEYEYEDVDLPSSEHDLLNTEKSRAATKGQNKDEYTDEGDPKYTCTHCGAMMWYGERLNKRRNAKIPTFSLCCMQGQVQLPLLKEPPSVLKKLMEGDDSESKHFQKNMRPYNMIFSFTSLGGKVERSVQKGKGPPMLVLQGENYHLMGILTPNNDSQAKFGQLYIADTENEVENRANCLSSGKSGFNSKKKDNLRKDIIEKLMKMLDEVNPYVKKFRTARDRFHIAPEDSFHMRIVSDRSKDGRTYNTPTASEVAALIPGDFNLDMDKRDIVLQQKSGNLLRINEIHASYLALQYPLLFTYGEDGFRLEDRSDIVCRIFKMKLDSLMDDLTKKKSSWQAYCIDVHGRVPETWLTTRTHSLIYGSFAQVSYNRSH